MMTASRKRIRLTMPTLYLLCGKIGAGKSTLARSSPRARRRC